MIIYAFSAYSGTGKTTLIEQLVKELTKRGLRVAVLKHDGHDFDMDTEGKDSQRFTNAGAMISVITSATKTMRMERRPQSLHQLLASVRDVDIILIEGWKFDRSIPRIGLARKETGAVFPDAIESYDALVCDFEVETDRKVFSFSDIEGISDFMTEQKEFTHFDDEGNARMVDVGEKEITNRTAVAAGTVYVNRQTYSLIQSGGMKKGDVLTVAQIAGVMGAKKTPDLIPMCHPILINGIDLKLKLNEEKCAVEIEASVKCDGRTGVEMEALTAVSVAALTVYDMCKAVQKDMVISDLRLLKKSGGVHGDFTREENE